MKRFTMKNSIIVWALGLVVALTACATPISTLGSEDNTFAASDTTTSKTGIQTWAISLSGKNTSVRGLQWFRERLREYNSTHETLLSRPQSPSRPSRQRR
jgi:hypothetical protein